MLLVGLLLQELYTSTQEASAAAASTGKRGTAGSSSSSRLDRREALVAAADVLLTCAVEGGNMARSAAPEVAARTRAALLAAAERSWLSVSPEPVVGAVAPPITSPEALRWLQLSARAFKAAGWKLQAGQLLLGLGDEDGGIHRRAARRLLQECEEKREVARIYEAVARQEMGLSASGDDAGTDAEAAGSGSSRAVVPKGVSAGFAASSRLLLDAWRIHLSLADYDKCRQLWQQWPGLKSLHKEREIDEFNMVRQAAARFAQCALCILVLLLSVPCPSFGGSRRCFEKEPCAHSLPVDRPSHDDVVLCAVPCYAVPVTACRPGSTPSAPRAAARSF
jgi:hypothetical protein